MLQLYNIFKINFIKNEVFSLTKIVKLRFAARRVDICEPPFVDSERSEEFPQGRAYRSREDLHSDTDVISLDS